MTAELPDRKNSSEASPSNPNPLWVNDASGWSLRRGLELALALFLVTCMWWPLCWWRIGAAPFYTKGEPREALVVWEMLRGSGWILPRRNGTEIPSKPPMFHWLGAAVSKAVGRIDEGTVRMPSALASLLGLYGVVLAGSAWWSVRAGLFSALVLATSFEWARAATNARVDMVLTLGLEFSFLALLFFWRSRRSVWLVLFYVAMAWAVLAKGPVGVVLPALASVALLATTWNAEAWHSGRWREAVDWRALRDLRPLRGLLFVAVVAGAWYVAALYEGGWAFFRKQILAENIFTFVDDPDWGGGHRHGLLYLPAQWLLGSLPWSLLWPAIAVALWRQRRCLQRSDPLVGLLIWILVVFVFYEGAASKRGVYLLALYPAVALVCGRWWAEIVPEEEASHARWRIALAYMAYGCAVVLSLAFIALVVLALGGGTLRDLLGEAYAPFWRILLGVARQATSPALVLGLLVCIGLWWWVGKMLHRGGWTKALGPLFLATWSVVVIARAWLLPAYAQQVTLRDFMAAVRSASAGQTVYFWGTFDYQAVYYFYRHIPALGAEALESAPAFLLVERKAWIDPANDWTARYEEVPLKVASEQAPARLVLLKRKES